MVSIAHSSQTCSSLPTATADNVMETGSPWVFRICAGSGAYAAATMAFLEGTKAPRQLAIVYENTNFGQSNAEAMQAAATKAGFEVLATEAYQAASPDYKALLQRVKARNPPDSLTGSSVSTRA